MAPAVSAKAKPAQAQEPMPMDLKESRAMVERWFELVDNGNVADLGEVLSQDFVFHHPGGVHQTQGLEEMKKLSAGTLDVFSNMKHEIFDVIAGQGKVVVRYVAKYTHVKEWMGVAPTNKRMSDTGILILRVEDGKFAEGWSEFDGLGYAQQLGLIPASPAE
jgi:predicted ester cyclase